MERKRKLPARAAARVEHVAKKRTITPPNKSRSQTPQTHVDDHPPHSLQQQQGAQKQQQPHPQRSSTTPAPPPAGSIPQPLPKSIQAGKPLPTIEEPQPEDLPNGEFQSVTESGVLSESLSRSRQQWIEGLFEMYWKKPNKRKGIPEDPENPPKESMQKLGVVTVTVEPHVFEATMYAVKEPKTEGPPPVTRPYIQYGPPNGSMPPPPPKTETPTTPNTPASTTASLPMSASAATSVSVVQAKQAPPTKASEPPPAQTPTGKLSQAEDKPQIKREPDLDQPESSTVPKSTMATPLATPSATAAPGAPFSSSKPEASPRGMESVLSPHTAAVAPPASTGPQSRPTTSSVMPQPSPSPSVASATAAPTPKTAAASGSGSQKPGTDPIIVTLAEKASSDPTLRDLMKRVAVGDAQKGELTHFQRIIDEITAEHKQRGGQQGPSAERLIVDGRPVKYFADEVNNILAVVRRSNRKQRGADLKAPTGGDALVVALVRKALDDDGISDRIKRVAEGKPQFSDATDLKATLDSLRAVIVKEKEKERAATAAAARAAVPRPPPAAAPAASHSTGPQSLRSKGPPPPPPIRRDISSVVLEFAGGTGDRYLFPKFSVLDPQNNGQQVIASFLIVRKGSTCEYGGDPKLDYYQPVTIRVYAHSTKHYEALQKIVAPAEEVRRYMEDIMDNMTRAEYVLLAMRLPKAEEKKDDDANGATTADGATVSNGNGDGNTKAPTPGARGGSEPKSGFKPVKGGPGLVAGGPAILSISHQATPPAVLWKSSPQPLKPSPVIRRVANEVPQGERGSSSGGKGEDGDYQSFLQGVVKKVEEVA